MQRQDLERMSREQLIAQAERLGIPRPRVLTQPELVDEIIGRTTKGDRERQKARGWLGRARDLLANVVEKGLHLPEAARVLRQEDKAWPAPPPPLPTVTLAEIYAAQGHFERAIAVLDDVLAREPDHREARTLRERFVEQAQRSRSRAGREKEAAPSVKDAPPTAKAAVAPAKDEPVKEAPPSPRSKAAAVQTAAVKAEPEPAAVTLAPEKIHAEATAIEPVVPSAEEPVPSTEDPLPSTEPAPVLVAQAEPALALDEAESDLSATLVSGPLDEPPLPQRYEVDEVVAIAVDPRTIYLYWEVRPTTLAHAQAGHPDGSLCVRLASVTASWEGPVVDTRDLHVDALYGDRFVRDVQPGSNVRVSIGWKSGAGFEPFAVGAEVMAPRMVPVESVSQEVARWEATPGAPFNAWRPDAPAAPVHRDEPSAPRSAWGQPAFVERVRATAGAPLSGRGGPVDTGVAIWGDDGTEPRDEEHEGDRILEASWYEPGGSSELARGGSGRVIAGRLRRLGPGRIVFGGASELGRA